MIPEYRKVKKKAGNSYACTIPSRFMEDARFNIGDGFKHQLEDNSVHLVKEEKKQNANKKKMGIHDVFMISSQRKITIPHEIVEQFKIKDGDYLIFTMKGNEIYYTKYFE